MAVTTGSDAESDPLAAALAGLAQTFAFPSRGRPVVGIGHYASVLDLGNNLGLAIGTDGVGTKLLVAEELGRFDTVGIDCVAMNANDVVCLGAEPIAMVDCLSVQVMDRELLAEVTKGLVEGARRAGISIPGGETARIPEMLAGPVDGKAIDLVGTCVGLVALDRVVTGARVKPGDALIGFASSGIHSNGLTLARRSFREAGWGLDRYVEEFGRTVGEELLEPTAMYVHLALDLLRSADVRALFHITGDGFLNLQRLEAEAGFDIEALPDAPAVFSVIAKLADLDAATLFAEYNMGTGFCAVVPEAEADAAIAAGERHGLAGWRLGTATASPDREIVIRPAGLRSEGKRFLRG